jgi:hypothetical protein
MAATEDAVAGCAWLTHVGVCGAHRAGAPFLVGQIDRSWVFPCVRGAVPQWCRHHRGPLGPLDVELRGQAVAVGLQALRGTSGLGQGNPAAMSPGHLAHEYCHPEQADGVGDHPGDEQPPHAESEGLSERVHGDGRRVLEGYVEGEPGGREKRNSPMAAMMFDLRC